MSEMTIENKKLMLAGMFLSKFNRQGLEALGYKSLQEAYNSFALAVGGKPSSVNPTFHVRPKFQLFSR